MLRSIRLAQRFGVSHSPDFQALYLPGGNPPPADQPFRNPALARTLQLLANGGGRTFYQGPLAQQILGRINALQTNEPNFRGWSPDDLASYAVVRRAPLCSQQLQHRICTMPPPSSGGLALLQTLALLNQSTNLLSTSAGEPQIWTLLARAQAWADADRLYWVHDPHDGAVPIAALLDPTYITTRARALQHADGARPAPGLPPGIERYPFGKPDQSIEQGTSQITIVDGNSNIVSYTSSVETIFGSRHLVAGMVMNNQLTDFSFRSSLGGKPVANRRLPGRRPMSSMAPTLVFHNGQPVLALGSPGGRSIPSTQPSAAGVTGLERNTSSGGGPAPSVPAGQHVGSGKRPSAAMADPYGADHNRGDTAASKHRQRHRFGAKVQWKLGGGG